MGSPQQELLVRFLLGVPSSRCGTPKIGRILRYRAGAGASLPLGKSVSSHSQLFSLILLAPVPHGVQNRFQAVSQFCKRILHPWRHLGVDGPGEQATVLHLTKLSRQHLLADIAHRFFSSPNRFVPGSKSRRINTFHLSLMRVSVVSTGQAGKVFAAISYPPVFWFLIGSYTCILPYYLHRRQGKMEPSILPGLHS